MTNWIQWEIADDDAENPLGKPGQFEFNVAFDYDPGDPDCVYDASLSERASCSPAAVITGAECTHIKLNAAPERAPTKEETPLLEDWFLAVINTDKKLRQQIEACGLDQMCVEPDYDDDWDD